MHTTFVTTDGVSTVYDTVRVKTLPPYAVIDDNSTVTVPVSSSEFYMVDMYLSGRNVTDIINVSAIMDSFTYACDIVPESFIEDVRERLSTILYTCMRREIDTDIKSECNDTLDMIKLITNKR